MARRSKEPPAKERKAAASGSNPGEQRHLRMRLGARFRNYFLTGLVVVGPVTITVYLVWWFIKAVDGWVRPFVPPMYDPETYLRFWVPGFGLLFAIVALTLIGALAANLLGRSLIDWGEMLLNRTPIVRNVYRALKQMFEISGGSSPS